MKHNNNKMECNNNAIKYNNTMKYNKNKKQHGHLPDVVRTEITQLHETVGQTTHKLNVVVTGTKDQHL